MWKALDQFEEWFLAGTLFIMLILTVLEVFSRYLFHWSLAFSEELTINLFVWSVMIGTATAAKHSHHLGLSLLTDYLPPNLQKWFAAGVAVLCVIIFALIGWYGVEMVQSQIEYNQKTPAMEMPEWVVGLAIPFGSVLCMVRFAQAGAAAWKKGGDRH